MKTRLSGLIAIIAFATQFVAGQNFRVEATNDDISYYLDLKAIASVFGDAYNLEDFERRINDYDNRMSNLDLNNDGMIDYLRVIEKPDRNLNIVVIQAVLDRDVFQDVATIVVEQNRYNSSYVQIVGAPFIYGTNYIIEPRYYSTPRILSWFRSPYYRSWYSPYYWGYYPNYYRYRHPVSINLYFSWTNRHINHDHYYSYTNRWRNSYAQRSYYGMSRNDFGNRYPERSYTKRNSNSTNRYDMDKRRDQESGNNPGRYDNNAPSRGTLNRYENSPVSERKNEEGSYNRNQSSDRNQNNGRNNSWSNREQNNNANDANNSNNREYNNDRKSGKPAANDTYRSNDSRPSSDRSSKVKSNDNQNRSENRSAASRGNNGSSNRESGGRR